MVREITLLAGAVAAVAVAMDAVIGVAVVLALVATEVVVLPP